jgi:hypothetical protein
MCIPPRPASLELARTHHNCIPHFLGICIFGFFGRAISVNDRLERIAATFDGANSAVTGSGTFPS